MYLLEDGTSLTETIKNAFKRGLTRAYIKHGNTIINQDNYLMSTKYKDEKADPENGQFIGITSMRELTIKLYNADNSINLENEEVEYYVGALVNGTYKYINFGKFIVQKADNQEVNEETTLTALDYMSKFDTDDEYIPQVVFPTTLLGLAQDVCNQAGVVLGNTNFRNANVQILANPFVDGENYRTVLKSIAKLAFSPAYIGQDNKLYIGFTVTENVTESVTIDDFFENKPNNEVKPITALTLRSSEVKAAGQTIYASDEMIEEYGVNELIIEEDYLAYTDTLRNTYLNGATDLFGLTYKPLSIDLLGSIYLTFNDVIQITNIQENVYTTYALNNTHEYNGTLYNTISAPALTENEEKYKYESEDKTYKRKTAIEIDKANQRIASIVSEIGDRSQKTTTITQDIDGIESIVQDLEDLTLTVNGINPLILENCLTGNLLQLNIIGNNTVFGGLMPNNLLTPSDDLVPSGGKSILKIYTINKCPDKEENWEQCIVNATTGIRNYTATNTKAVLTNKEFIDISERETYISIQNSSYKIINCYGYTENGTFVESKSSIFGWSANKQEGYVYWNENVKKILISISLLDYTEGSSPNYPEIQPFEIVDIQPMLTYNEEKQEYVGYNTQNIDLGINAPLRQYSPTVYDEFVYDFEDEENLAKVIRRVGVTGNGVMYELAQEEIEILDISEILLVKGTNIIDLYEDYSANMTARYVQVTQFTKNFATTYEVQSSIKQLANQIMLVVNEKVGQDEFQSTVSVLSNEIDLKTEHKVGEDEIIAKLNLAVADGQGIITIIGNLIRIITDYFKINLDGTIEATGGTIAGLTMYRNPTSGTSWLYKRSNNNTYESGFMIPNNIGNSGQTAFLYTGTSGGGSPYLAKTWLSHQGNLYFRSGSLFMIYEPTSDGSGGYRWQNAMEFTYDALNRYLSNGNRWTTEGIGYSGNTPQMHTLWLYDALAYSIESGVHDTTLARFYRVGNNAEPAEIDFYATSYINGQQIQVATSDERMKENIKPSELEALPIIDEVEFEQFDWKEDSGYEGHVDIGFIAQWLEKIYKKLVIHNITRDNEVYSVDLLNTLALTMKGVQELNRKVNKQQEEIDLLKEEIKRMKGEN